jgi:hypothetical protein
MSHLVERIYVCDFSRDAAMTALEIAPESDVVFAGFADGQIAALDGSNSSTLGKRRIHEAPIVCIAPGRAGKLATVATDVQIKVWRWS